MRDGDYAIRLDAGAYSGGASFKLNGRSGQGHDGVWRIAIDFSGVGARCDGTALIEMPPDLVRNRSMPERYEVDLTGSSNDRSFSVLGIGPLGLIVEVVGNWVDGGTLTAER